MTTALSGKRMLLSVLATAILLVASLPATATEPWTVHQDIDYDLGSPPGQDGANTLDLYVPSGSNELRPVVVYVHGGAWAIGDKANVHFKPDLFTGRLGYVFASLNYRLSPYPPLPVLPDRVMFPDHPQDIGEALGWLHANVATYGGDPNQMLLIGHSAGAHLAALAGTDPSYHTDYGVPSGAVRGVVALDTEAYDIPRFLRQGAGAAGYATYWNAFGNPAEEVLQPRWEHASPISHASEIDPTFMLVVQDADPERIDQARALALALGQDPAHSVHTYAKSHQELNRDLGSPDDSTTYTTDVEGFVTAILG